MKNDYTNKLQFDTFNWIKLPLILCVIFIHNFGEGNYDVTIEWGNYYNIIRVAISHVFTHIAVPSFFVISGYLFFRNFIKWDFVIWKDKIGRRISTLLIPYIVWISICIVLNIFLGIRREGLDFVQEYFQENNGWHLFWDCNTWNEDRINIIGQTTPASSPKLTPLWYLRDLMVVTFLTPILLWVLKMPKYIGIIILCILYIINFNYGIPGFSTTAFFFFGLGGCVAINQYNFIIFIRKAEMLSYILYVPLLIIEIIYDGHNTIIGEYFYPYYIIVGTIALLNMASRAVEKGVALWLNKYTYTVFFVFAAHELIMGHLRRILQIFLTPMVTYLIVPIITLTICIGLCILINRFFPKLGKVLTGNR